jgi:hypothetical protein
MADFSKAERRVLREIAGKVREAEAHRMLEKLDDRFLLWRNGKVLSAELFEDIHQFHQREARDLGSIYRALSEQEAVARGVALKLISEASVPHDLLAKLASGIEFYRKHHMTYDASGENNGA